MNLTQSSAASETFEGGYALIGRVTQAQDWESGLAICSNCREVAPIGAEAGPDSDSVLLDAPCPRCGEAAMRVSDGTWD